MSAEAEKGLVNVNVLFFAKSRDLAQTSRAVFTVEPVIVAKNLLNLLIERFNLSLISNSVILALNENYIDNIDDEIHLKQGDEIAVIPPISGG